MCSGVPYESWSTELALGPGGVIDAAEAVAGVGVTELGGALRVCIPTAVTWNASPRRFVEAGAALVTLWTSIVGKALVTYWRATGIWTGADNSIHQKVANDVGKRLGKSEILNTFCYNSCEVTNESNY